MTFDDTITNDLERQAIELPSWAFGNSGTRFKVFAQPGVPRDPFEKIADAAQLAFLNACLDRGLTNEIGSRFQTIEALVQRLNELLHPPSAPML